MTSIATAAWRWAAGMAAAAILGSASAAPYPERAITWIVAFAVGCPTHDIDRTVAQRLAIELGQIIIFQDLPCAVATHDAQAAARAKPDGYTLFGGHIGTMAVAPYLFKSLKYDPLRDFTPVFRFPDTPMVLLVKQDARYNSAADLLAEARKHPEKLTFGTAGVGSSSHLAAEHLAATAQVKFTFVPYKGTGPAMTDLMGGQI